MANTRRALDADPVQETTRVVSAQKLLNEYSAKYATATNESERTARARPMVNQARLLLRLGYWPAANDGYVFLPDGRLVAGKRTDAGANSYRFEYQPAVEINLPDGKTAALA